MQTVYLVGPITGCSYDGCTEWRDGVKETLESTGRYRCFTPMRGKKHLKGHQNLQAIVPEGVRTPGCTDHDIVSRDYYDCQRADVVFCNLLGSEIVSIGSMFELAWSFANPSSFSVVLLEPENIHWHAFVTQAAGIILPTLDAGVEYLVEVLNT